jgi:hypothetical protein
MKPNAFDFQMRSFALFAADVLVCIGFYRAPSYYQHRIQMRGLHSCALDSPNTRSLCSKDDVLSSFCSSN